MTEKELRQQIAATAMAWLGIRESGGGHRPILAVYNAIRPLPAGYSMKDTDPWCAAFVSAAAAQCGLTDVVFPECSCPRMADLYKAAGRWEEVDFAVPKVGDVVFYDWNGDRVADHVGLVTDAEGDYITVIEGNKSDAVGTRRIHLDNQYILGYGQPDYLRHAECAAESGKSEAQAAAEETKPAELPQLSQGAQGEAVRAAQLLLIGRGCSCGASGADGEFGPATRGAVLRYQRSRALGSDGVIGPETWGSLLGLRGAA